MMRTARTLAKHRCRRCSAYMAERRRNDWICPECFKLERRELRAKAAAKQGRTLYRYRSADWLRSKPKPNTEQELEALAEKNAKQAWSYWLQAKAPADWLRARNNEQWRMRYRSDPEFHLKERLRVWVRKQSRRRWDENVRRALRVQTAKSKWMEQTLGYDVAQLRAHIERQFTKGMSWEAFTAGLIHIDHVVPLSQFNMSDLDQAKAAWALANIRPLWARDNLVKGKVRTTLV